MYYRYSRWDGTQQIAPFDADDLLEAMADDLMTDGDLKRALRKMMQWGGENQQGDRIMGMQELIERLRQQRRKQLDRYDLGSIMDDIKQALDEIRQMERDTVERRLAEARGEEPPTGDQAEDEKQSESHMPGMDEQGLESQPSGLEGNQADPGEDGEQVQRWSSGASGKSGQSQNQQGQSGQQGQQGQPGQSGQPGEPGDPDDALRKMLESIASKKLDFLDTLPEDVGGQIGALNDYEFMDPEAQARFKELLQMLQQQVMNQTFQGMQQAMQNLSPQDMQNLRDMVRDLNQMMRDRAEGKNPDFQRFMEQHGQFFPPGLQNLDELMEHLANAMNQMQSLMNSMTAEQRNEMQNMMANVMADPQFAEQMSELAQLLDQMMPGRMDGQRYPFRGDESLTLAEAMRMMEQLEDMDGLERDLKSIRDYDDLEKLDPEKIRQLIGDEEAENVDELKRLMETLEEAGMIERNGNKFDLTPRAMRKIGDKALRDIFQNLKRNGFGNHDLRDQRGIGGERLDETKVYEFGDPFLMDLQKTVMNSVARSGSGTPLRLNPDDFEVYRTELITQSATVLLVDMSRSMLLRGCFLAAKKVAMALQSLIKSQFPKDALLIVGFSYIARELKPEQLTALSWEEYEYGTNLQHGLEVARNYLAKQKAANKEIIVITDGEPTAHFEGGRVHFAYPPTFRTIQETLREVRRCTRDQITINTFMLETGDYLMDFVDQMTKINRGRAFFANPDKLGEYVLVDYIQNKRKRVA